MKKLGVLVLLALASCNTPERMAQRDEQYCAKMGVTQGHPEYMNCRYMAAQIRLQEDENRQRAASALMGYGAAVQSMNQPRRPVTCVNHGNIVTCN